MRRWRLLGPVGAVVLGLGAAACGGGASPTVAHLGSTTTTAAATSSGGSGKPTLAQAEQYAQCMRSHGVAGFPDPTAGPNGSFGFRVDGPKMGASQSQVQSAQQACRKLLPNNGVAPQLTAAQQQAFLNWVACIRAHGFPNMPDPDFSGGGVRIKVGDGNVGPANGGGPSPAFQAAQKACQSKMPAGFGK